MILAACSLLGLASALRLITLPPLDRKGNGIFVKNNDLKLKLEKATPSNILDMYVVVHSKKIYFYNKGSYYGFGYDNDNITLKLNPVPVGKVHYFTQETIDRPRPRRIRLGRAMRRDDDDFGIKTIRTVKTVSEKEALEEDSTSRMPTYVLRTKASGRRCSAEDGSDEKVCDAEDAKPKADYSALLMNLGEILHSYKNPVQAAPSAQEKDIESDSEMLEGQSLDIWIEMQDKKEQTFVLKNEKNMCVTYFQKSFIMAACAKSRRQTFKLVNAEDVASRFKEPEKSSAGFDGIGSEESSSSEEKPAAVHEPARKKVNKKTGKKHLRKSDDGAKGRGKKRKEKSKKPVEDSDRAPSSTSVSPDSNAESGETKPVEKRPEPDSSISNPMLPKAVPVPRRIDEYCREVYSRVRGQIDRLPEECLVFFGFKHAPLPVFKRAVKIPIPAAQRMGTVMRVPKGTSVVERRPMEQPPAVNAEHRSINMIERLEKALGADTFLK